MIIFVLPIIIWWIYYLVRLFNHAHDDEFLKMPWLYLWAAAYNTGWCYTLSHFFVLERLEVTLFGFSRFPLASLICASLYFLQNVSFLWVVKRHFTKLLILTLVILGMMYGVVLVAHISPLAYTTRYRYDVILIFISSSIAGLTLFFTLRKEIRFPSTHIGFAHIFWLTIFWLLSAIGLALIALNAVLGLAGDKVAVETPLQGIGYMCNALAMATMMIVTGHDTLLYRSIYPFRLWQYHKLLKLKDFILQHLEIEPIIAPDTANTVSIEIAVHETLIAILDYYPYLLNNEALQLNLRTIEANAHDLESMLFKITRLKLPQTN